MPTAIDASPAAENRLLDALLLHTHQEVSYRLARPAVSRNDPVTLELQESHFRNVLEAYRKAKELTPAERSTRRYLRHALRRSRLRQRPLAYRLVYQAASWLVNTAIGRRSNIVQHRKQIATYEKGVAVEQNVQLLGESLRSAGFGLVPEQTLQDRLKHQLPSFDIRYNDPNYPKTDFILHIKKLPGADAYYLAGFDALSTPTLKDVLSTLHNQGKKGSMESQPRMQFDRTNGYEFSAKEASNLVNGRPILKEVAGEAQWFRPGASLSAGEYRPEFDVQTALRELPIKEMKQPISRNNLVVALQEGAQREVTLQLSGGQEEKALISVAADARSVQLHSPEGRYLDLNDFANRLSVACQTHQQAQVRRLQPVQKKGRAKAL